MLRSLSPCLLCVAACTSARNEQVQKPMFPVLAEAEEGASGPMAPTRSALTQTDPTAANPDQQHAISFAAWEVFDTILETAHATQIPRPPIPPEHIAEQVLPYILYLRVYDEHGGLEKTGTGFIVFSPLTMGLTSDHLVADHWADPLARITAAPVVGAHQGNEFNLVVIHRDQQPDHAWFVLPDALSLAQELPGPGPLLSARTPKIGETAYVVGNPLGLQGTFSSGEVSAIRNGAIQVSAPISPGSSGGPILDRSGYVIGIVRSTIIQGQNLNLAVPVEDVLRSALALRDKWRAKAAEQVNEH